MDAYCIACSHLKPEETLVETEPFEILQFRKHNRAIIHHQTERTYKLDGVTVAKNRKKRMEQKTDSLEDWYVDMAKEHGKTQADAMRSRLAVIKSTRYYNTPGRMMPGTVFLYEGKRYVMTGQITNGKYYRAYDQEKRNFPAVKVRILTKNTGLVFVA